MNEQIKETMTFLSQNYTPLIEIHLKENKKIYLGNKGKRKCRFCGKEKPEVTFRKRAHAIPEFTGNNKLFSYYECDTCNERISSLMESHMANYMNIWHTFSKVSGKRGVPSFKTNAKKSRVDLLNGHLHIEDDEEDKITEVDEENKQIKITASMATYILIAVYKCLTKMAITIMPEKELDKFKDTLDWLKEDNHNKSKYKLKDLYLLFSFAEGIKPFAFQSCFLYKRKEKHKDNVPYMLFLMAYHNFVFQIYLPLCSEDKKLFGQKVTTKFIPTPIDLKDGKIERWKIDLSSTENVKGEKATITMKGEKIIIGNNI